MANCLYPVPTAGSVNFSHGVLELSPVEATGIQSSGPDYGVIDRRWLRYYNWKAPSMPINNEESPGAVRGWEKKGVCRMEEGVLTHWVSLLTPRRGRHGGNIIRVCTHKRGSHSHCFIMDPPEQVGTGVTWLSCYLTSQQHKRIVLWLWYCSTIE